MASSDCRRILRRLDGSDRGIPLRADLILTVDFGSDGPGRVDQNGAAHLAGLGGDGGARSGVDAPVAAVLPRARGRQRRTR